MNVARIAFHIVALGAVFLMPWWAAGAVLLVLLWRFAPFYEVVLYGLILDALYTVPQSQLFSFGMPFTFLFLIFLFISLYTKDRIRIGV